MPRDRRKTAFPAPGRASPTAQTARGALLGPHWGEIVESDISSQGDANNSILAECRTQVRSFRIEIFSALEMYFLLTQVDENSFTIPTAANG